MTQEQLDVSFQTGRLRLNFWQRVTHFWVVAFLMCVPFFTLLFYFKDYFFGIPKALKTFDYWNIAIWTVLAILAYYLQKRRLRFKIIQIKLDRQTIESIVEKVANELEWHPHIVSNQVIIAKTHPGFSSGSWGEQITILLDEDRILINSICDPDKKESLISMGRNKKNVNRFIEEVKSAANEVTN